MAPEKLLRLCAAKHHVPSEPQQHDLRDLVCSVWITKVTTWPDARSQPQLCSDVGQPHTCLQSHSPQTSSWPHGRHRRSQKSCCGESTPVPAVRRGLWGCVRPPPSPPAPTAAVGGAWDGAVMSHLSLPCHSQLSYLSTEKTTADFSSSQSCSCF